MKIIVAAAVAMGLVSSTALAQQWTEEELHSGIKKSEFVRFAFAGVKMRIGNLYAVDLDCSVIPGWAFEISKQPEHGTAEITSSAFFPSFTKDSPRYRCNENKIDGLVLWYTPRANYKGPDILSLLKIGPTGLAFEETYNFNVRPAPMNLTGPKQKGA